MTTLTLASHEWASRPADQRFPSLDALHAAVTHHREVAVESKPLALASLRVQVDESDDLRLVGQNGRDAGFTHWSFGQLSRRIGAPASYLRTLPSALAAENLNHGLQTVRHSEGEDDGPSRLLLSKNGDMTVRAVTSDGYKRIWNHDITSRLLRLRERYPEWQEAPASFGDGSRGMYASDEDIFCFMVDNDRRIFESAPGGGLSRGFFCWNSEVGSQSFGIMAFKYHHICGNHMVWGAEGVTELRIRHVGSADERAFASLQGELRKYADSSAAADELKIERAMRMSLGDDKDAVLDKVFGLNVAGLSRGVIKEAYQLAANHDEWYGSPRTVWGMVNGITEYARDLPNANDRTRLDRAAGKVMQIAF